MPKENKVTDKSQKDEKKRDYLPRPWEKSIVYAIAILVFLLVGYLIIKNNKIHPDLAVYIRMLLSFALAVLGATIPGFLHIEWKGQGAAIRASGALALFVLTYVLTPEINVASYNFRLIALSPEGTPVQDAEINTPLGEVKKTIGGWELTIHSSEKPESDVLPIFANRRESSQHSRAEIHFNKESNNIIILQFKDNTTSRIRGVIVDPNGTKVSNAKVMVLGYENESVRTGVDGHFELNAHAAQGKEVRITAQKGNLRWSGYIQSGNSMEIRLEEHTR